MPNWVHNTLRVKGTKKRLTQFAWAIGSPSAVINWAQLATLIPATWDSRDEQSAGQLEIHGRDLVYEFDTAWNPRLQLIEDLAALYPDLTFELQYVEEGPAFAGAVVFRQGRKVGEAYLGDGEECTFFEPYDENDDDGEWDYTGMTASVLERARGGEKIDWDARRQRVEQARKASENQAAKEAGDSLQQAVSYIQTNPDLRVDSERRNKVLIPLASRTGPGLRVIPKAWWNDDLLVAFLLQQYEQAKLIPASLCTETLVDKLLAVESRGYAGLYPIPFLKVGLHNERQALEYVKRAPGSLGTVPRALRSALVCEQAVKGDGKALEHVPKTLRTSALCNAAVANTGEALEFVPVNLKTAAMCRKAVTPENPNILKFVPAKFLDEALLETALNNTHSWKPLRLGSVKSVALRRKYLLQIIAEDGWSSIEAMTEKEHEHAWSDPAGQALLCKLLEDDSVGILDKVPVRFHTPEVLAAAGKHSALANFKFIPDKYKTQALCRKAIEADSWWGGQALYHVPMTLRDRSMCSLALDKALSGRGNIFRTEKFKNELFVWLSKSDEGKKTAREYCSTCFVESAFPEQVWDSRLVSCAVASSPYAVLFIPRRYVNEELLLQVLQDYFPMYLLLEKDVAKELALPAASILRNYVGERAWQLGTYWQSLNEILKSSDKSSLCELLDRHAIRWLMSEIESSTIERILNGVPSGDQIKLVKFLMSSRRNADQVFPDWVGRLTLTAKEMHRLIFACDKLDQN